MVTNLGIATSGSGVPTARRAPRVAAVRYTRSGDCLGLNHIDATEINPIEFDEG
jgi:hypothetical protein